jgi:hypothetical protein
MASASDSHDEMYWSVAVPLNSGMAWRSSRRFNAVIKSSNADVAMSSVSIDADCSLKSTFGMGDGDWWSDRLCGSVGEMEGNSASSWS